MLIFSLDEELKKIKKSALSEEVGMILIHNGIVRKSSKDKNGSVYGMNLSYDKKKLQNAIDVTLETKGINRVIVKINEGTLKVGDDMMYVIVAGDRRENILEPFENLIENIKKNVVNEEEIIA